MFPPSELNRALVAGAAVTLLAGFGCASKQPAPPPDAGGVALQLFDIASAEDPTREQLEALFELDSDDDRTADLYDALRGLAPVEQPEIVQVTELAALRKTSVDLTGSLPGGGTAGFSVELLSPAEGTWRISWFRGPGVEWPRSRLRRDQGISTSPPPD